MTPSLEHELTDCLWSILVLADRLDVDLAAAFDATMTSLEEQVGTQVITAEATRP